MAACRRANKPPYGAAQRKRGGIERNREKGKKNITQVSLMELNESEPTEEVAKKRKILSKPEYLALHRDNHSRKPDIGYGAGVI